MQVRVYLPCPGRTESPRVAVAHLSRAVNQFYIVDTSAHSERATNCSVGEFSQYRLLAAGCTVYRKQCSYVLSFDSVVTVVAGMYLNDWIGGAASS